MSAPTAAAAPAPEAAPAPGATSPRPTERGRRPGWLVAAVVLVLVATTVTIMARGAYRDGPLEPGAPTPQGSKALVQVLGRDGVETETLRHAADAAAELRAGRPVLLDASGGLSPPSSTCWPRPTARAAAAWSCCAPTSPPCGSSPPGSSPPAASRRRAT